jgi:ribosomal protein S17E
MKKHREAEKNVDTADDENAETVCEMKNRNNTKYLDELRTSVSKPTSQTIAGYLGCHPGRRTR